MSYGDPDFAPKASRKRQILQQDENMERIVLNMRCHGCNTRLVKQSFLVERPISPALRQGINTFYEQEHFCDSCS